MTIEFDDGNLKQHKQVCTKTLNCCEHADNCSIHMDPEYKPGKCDCSIATSTNN